MKLKVDCKADALSATTAVTDPKFYASTNGMKNKSIASLILVTLVVIAAGAICVAQSTNHPPASSANPTLSQPQSLERFRSFTGASNLSDAATSALINESLKTNAAVQVWARMQFSLLEGEKAADIAQVVRVLKSLREGNTNDAIRQLEAKLDGDLITLNQWLTLPEPVLKFELRERDLYVLQEAREYRLKYAHKSGDPLTEARVQEAFSLGEKK